MGDKTGIQWTDATWGPIRGCSRVSEGCRNCYAETMAARFCDEGQPYYGLAKRTASGPRWTGKIMFVTEHLSDPIRWQKPRKIFVNSMSDLFHEELTNEQIAAIFGVMAATPRHVFQVLTKRAKRMAEWFKWVNEHGEIRALRRCGDAAERAGAPVYVQNKKGHSPWNDNGCVWPLPNVWLGVSVENQEAADERIPELLKVPAAVHWLSCEPLLGPLDLSKWMNREQQSQDGREVRVSGRDQQRDGDRRSGEDLAHRKAQRDQGRSDNLHSSTSTSSRTTPGSIPERSRNDRPEEDDGLGPSDGMAPHQRANPRRDDDKSQERDQGRQSSEQSGAGHGLRATDSRESNTRDRLRGESMGREELPSQANAPASARDQETLPIGSPGDGSGDCIPCDLPADLQGHKRKQQIKWIVVGCESGPGARPCHVGWLRTLRDQCRAASVKFFLKQATAAQEGGHRLYPSGQAARSEVVDVIKAGEGSKMKPGGVIGLPYLDGSQHAEFPA